MAIAGALALPRHPVIGYLAGSTAGSFFRRKTVATELEEMLHGEVGIHGDGGAESVDVVFGADWRDYLATGGKIAGKVAGAVVNVYAPGAGTALSKAVDTGVSMARPGQQSEAGVLPGQPGLAQIPGTPGTGTPGGFLSREDVERREMEARRARELEEARASASRWKTGLAVTGGVVGVAGVGDLIIRA